MKCVQIGGHKIAGLTGKFEGVCDTSTGIDQGHLK